MRTFLYLVARIMGDLNAIRRGTILERIARRALGRLAHRAIMKIVPPRRRT